MWEWGRSWRSARISGISMQQDRCSLHRSGRHREGGRFLSSFSALLQGNWVLKVSVNFYVLWTTFKIVVNIAYIILMIEVIKHGVQITCFTSLAAQ
jgi:hypothetical protein